MFFGIMFLLIAFAALIGVGFLSRSRGDFYLAIEHSAGHILLGRTCGRRGLRVASAALGVAPALVSAMSAAMSAIAAASAAGAGTVVVVAAASAAVSAIG